MQIRGRISSRPGLQSAFEAPDSVEATFRRAMEERRKLGADIIATVQVTEQLQVRSEQLARNLKAHAALPAGRAGALFAVPPWRSARMVRSRRPLACFWNAFEPLKLAILMASAPERLVCLVCSDEKDHILRHCA